MKRKLFDNNRVLLVNSSPASSTVPSKKEEALEVVPPVVKVKGAKVTKDRKGTSKKEAAAKVSKAAYRGAQKYRSFETGEELKVERATQHKYVVHFKSGAERISVGELKDNFAYVGEWYEE